MSRLTFEMSEDARLLSQRLLKSESAELIKYDELTKVIGKPIIASRGALQTARRHALREEGFVFGVERGVGIRRLTNDEIVSSTAQDRRHYHKALNRSVRKLTAADYNKLSNDKQLKYTSTLSIFTQMKAAVSDRSVQAIQVLGGSSKSLPIRETLQALLRNQEA